MYGSRFDDLTRTLVTSRRGALRTIAAALVGGLAHVRVSQAQSDDEEEELSEHEQERAEREAEREAEQAAREAEREAEEAEREAEEAVREAELAASEAEQAAEAAEREAELAERRARPFLRAGRRCDNGQPCGSMAPCTNGFCTPIACDIGGQPVSAGTINPDNPCQFCEPSLSVWTGWTSFIDDGVECILATDDPCLTIEGFCLDGQCVNEAFPDGSPCGPSNVCCAGICCDPGECCSDSGECVSCEPHCEIGGTEYATGTINPNHDCQICDPSRSTTDWSVVLEERTCGTIAGRVCCNGECCSPTECCNGLACEECGPHCRIGNEDIDAGAPNPDVECQVCNPETNLTNWSVAGDGAECGDFLQVCCNGECCPPEACCREDRTCGVCPCEIGPDTWGDGTTNPSNDCQVCDSGRDSDDWTSKPPRTACGSNGDRECCDGEYCPRNECCTLDGCGECPCDIGFSEIVDGDFNRANSCQVCDVDENRFDWTVIGNGEPCADDDNRECCAGPCCPAGQCCVDGQCRPCGCEIGGVPFEPDEVNDNPCQVCKPALSRSEWSPAGNGLSCGPDGEKCCGTDCCEGDECSVLDACGTCLCQIGGDVNVPDQTQNPDNPCQFCDASAEPFDWTNKQDRTSCGDDRICCTGTCCDEGECCVLGLCSSCACQIGEDTVPDGAINPENSCQKCDPVLDPAGWSPNDDTPCGDDLTQVCCGGECCAESFCCGVQGACETCRCLIDATDFFDHGVTNPANECEFCNTGLDRFGWTPVDDDTECGDGEQKCCRGTCCAEGQCCVLGACAACPCEIDGATFLAGDPNPENDCEVCKPEVDRFAWTLADDDTNCGGVFDRVCCAGTCCESRQCCTPGVCGMCGCLIDEVEHEEFEVNEENECQWCDPVLDQFSWSPRDDAACGENDDQMCCNSQCCEAHECCDLNSLVCTACKCLIGGETYEKDDRNPENDCEICDPSENHEGWTQADNHFACGESGSQFCCSGSCCPDGQCCQSLEGACGEGPCECTIGEDIVFEGTVDPDNPCRHCNPRENETDWTPVDDFIRCDDPLSMFARDCCRGVCCAEEECCRSDGSCGPCECLIEDVPYARLAENPDNDCQYCSPSQLVDGWTTADDGSACGENDDQFCCGGICGPCPCSAEAARLAGVADECFLGCTIDGTDYQEGDRNPANDCEVCDPSQSETAWSIAPFFTKCGEKLDRMCCEGSCCASGTCCRPGFSSCSIEWCGLFDPCDFLDPCGCTIDGQLYAHFAPNPKNDCQECVAWWSETDWTTKSPNARCGAFEDQFCCGETCCEVGTCCNEEDICEFEGSFSCIGCLINGRFFRNNERNPDNACEICQTSQSKTAWSHAPNHNICDTVFVEDVGTVPLLCCEGVCCPNPEDCCTNSGICRATALGDCQ